MASTWYSGDKRFGCKECEKHLIGPFVNLVLLLLIPIVVLLVVPTIALIRS